VSDLASRVLASLPAVLLLALAFCAVPAPAHEWLGGLKDPETGHLCCNDYDCHPEPVGGVVPVEGGFLILKTGEVFPASRAQWSPDGLYWRCQFPGEAKARCLFVPPQGS